MIDRHTLRTTEIEPGDIIHHPEGDVTVIRTAEPAHDVTGLPVHRLWGRLPAEGDREGYLSFGVGALVCYPVTRP